MKFTQWNSRQKFFVNLLLFGLLLAACAPRTESPYRDYYVSTTGNDSTGDGSAARPWRTIQYAHDHADYSGAPVQVNIAAGAYRENLRITNSIILRGAGAGNPLTTSGLTDIEWASRPAGARDPAHSITNDAHVEIYDLVFQNGRLQATGGQLVVQNVWFNYIQGFYGLHLQDVGSFSIIDSEFRNQPGLFTDYGIWVINSTGEIIGGYVGDYADHAIDIARYPEAGPMIVNIDGVTVRGSTVCYADGIRVSGAPLVDITNSDIRREHADADAACQILHGPISGDGIAAGIGYQRVPVRGGVIVNTISGNTVSGFDMGMAFDLRRTRIKAENNDISGLTYGVLAWRWVDATTNAGTILDFGGGPLGSVGGNTFQNTGDDAFYNDETYDVSACNNEWIVPDDQIDPDRIFDRLDDSTHGRVMWTCTTSEPIVIGPTETLAQIYTPTPDKPTLITTVDTGCFKGPGEAWTRYNTLKAGLQAQVVGKGFGVDWLVAQHPEFSNINCWVKLKDVKFDFPLDQLRLIAIPGKPTATPNTTNQPRNDQPIPTVCFYNQQQQYICK
jgi:hypothetical protein